MHPNYWGYVAAGYVLTFGTIGAYTLWLRRRLAGARRAQAPQHAQAAQDPS